MLRVPKPLSSENRNAWFVFFRRCTIRFILIAILGIGGFWLAAWVLGNTPVNRDFQHAKDGIEIVLVNNGVHVDIVLPLESPEFRWTEYLLPQHFKQVRPELQFCMFGWGNRQFYMETETWDDLNVTNVLYALAGMGETVVHVQMCSKTGWLEERIRRIRLSPEQYQLLCAYLLKTFRRTESGDLVAIDNAHYGFDDAFYEAKGHYHLFRTCNVWVGQALAHSGVRVGYWTLTPHWLFACLPSEEKLENSDQK